MSGAVLMGLLSLVRFPPTIAMVNARSLISTMVTVLAPVMMRPENPSVGLIAGCAVVIQLIGVVLTQIARLYLGRRFGLLPANRGIVCVGPFRLVRHPIYAGWLVLALGFLMAFPTVFNLMMVLVSIPFVAWRIALEEKLLLQDPDYQVYCIATPYRLIPGVF